VIVIAHHVTHRGLVLIQTREQRSTRRTTSGRVIELRESNTVVRQLIKIRSLNLAAVTAEIRKAHVVVENQNDVWSVSHFVNLKSWFDGLLSIGLPFLIAEPENQSAHFM
jgi:hypothetical protein